MQVNLGASESLNSMKELENEFNSSGRYYLAWEREEEEMCVL